MNVFWQVVKLRTKNQLPGNLHIIGKLFGKLSCFHASAFHWNSKIEPISHLIIVMAWKQDAPPEMISSHCGAHCVS